MAKNKKKRKKKERRSIIRLNPDHSAQFFRPLEIRWKIRVPFE